MFEDNHAPESTLDPASTLLMDLIRSPKKTDMGITEPSSEASESKTIERPLENFISDHESAILNNAHREAALEKQSASLDETDFFSESDSFTGRPPLRLRWWERLFSTESVGLEVNGHTLRAAKVRRSGTKCEVVGLEEFDLEGLQPDPSETVRQIKALVKKLHASSLPITSVIGGADITIRLLRMPKVSKKELHDALLWKNKKELHLFNDASTVLHYVILDDDQASNSNEFYVLVIAAKEEYIKSHLAILRSAGLVPAALTIKAVAHWNLIKTLPNDGAHRMILDTGFESSTISFFRGQTLEFSREIMVGGNHFTNALMQTIFADQTSFELSWEEAEAIKKDIGLMTDPADGKTPQGIPHSEISVMLRPLAEKLASDIRVSLDYYKSNFKIGSFDTIYLTGNAARMKGLPSYLSAQIGQPLSPLNPFAAISRSGDAENKDPWRVSIDAIGAAISRESDFNFLPQSVKTETRFRRACGRAIRGLALLAVTLGTSLFLQTVKLRDSDATLTLMSGSINALQPENQNYDQWMARKSALNALEARLLAESSPDSTMVGILKWITTVTPDQIAITELTWGHAYNDLEIRRESTDRLLKANGTSTAGSDAELRIKGVVYKDAFYADIHLLNFISAIEQNPYFRPVTIKEKRRDDIEDKMFFELVTSKKQ